MHRQSCTYNEHRRAIFMRLAIAVFPLTVDNPHKFLLRLGIFMGSLGQ